MLRVSDYIISIPLNNNENEFLIVHGYSGALDVISSDIESQINECKLNYEKIELLDKNLLKNMIKRGYITNKSKEKEREIFSSISNKMHSIAKKKIGLTIVPSYNCNFRCPYCFEASNYINKNGLLKKVMNKELIDKTLNAYCSMKENGKRVYDKITLFGGEPLMESNYDIIKYIVDKCKKLKLKIGAISNGYDLKYYDDLLSKEKISEIQITVDGLSDVHNKRRVAVGGKPTFDTIIENIDWVLKKGIKISVRTNVDNDNFNQITKLIELYRSKGWTEKENFYYNFKSVYDCTVEDSELTDKKILEELNKYELSKSNYNRVGQYNRLYNILLNLIKNKRMLLLKSEFCASVAGSMIVVDPFGDIYPCWETIGKKNNIIGKVTDIGFTFNTNYNHWSNRSVDKIEKCTSCSYGMFCGGGCPAHAQNYYGNIYNPYCNHFKEIFEEIIIASYSEAISLESKYI